MNLPPLVVTNPAGAADAVIDPNGLAGKINENIKISLDNCR